jgi:two-component system chemotaxis sensor kinase CheA
MDMSQYLSLFIDESKDNLQSLNEQLLKLEEDPNNISILNDIFRVAHTLKGMAGTMSFVRMQKLTHNAENVLSEIRNGKIKVTAEMVDILFQCLDALENYVQEIENSGTEGLEDYTSIIDALTNILDNKPIKNTTESQTVESVKEESAIKQISSIKLPDTQMRIKEEALKQNMSVYEMHITLSASCVLKSARAFVIFTELERIGEIIYANPEVQDIEDEKFDQSFTLVFVTQTSQKEIKEIIMSVSEVDSVALNEYEREINEEGERVEEVSSQEDTQVAQVEASLETKEDKQAAQAKGQVAGKSVRVNIERLDTLMNLVSELIIVKTQLEGIKQQSSATDANYNDSVEYLERVTTNLHDAVMKVRMVPVESVFNRFPRMIRDVSRKLNKDIDLLMSGEETELDRTVIDEIGDPLIHLLRNAADHGLETTKERIDSGKNQKGIIRLQAYQDGNSVIIEVSDDGKGIDVDKIREKALSKGQITKEESMTMSNPEILDLLFKPSFSTAEKITDLSGRGVGLDVVKSKITALGGNVEVKTELGKGSSFIVRLPLTLAIIQALMVMIGEEKYAIPLNTIQNIEDVRKEDIKLVQNQEVIVLRDQVIPLVRLRSLLDIEETEKDHMMVVIVRKGEKQIGFIIDSLIGQQEIVIKPLGKYLSHITMIAGATILGNGEVALILDINTLM